MATVHPDAVPDCSTASSVRRLPPVREGEALRHVAMPLGGIGAGHVAICGDGGLRQWQLHNIPNHRGFIPNSFFAVRATTTEPPIDVIRLLQSREVAALPGSDTPLIDDDAIPDEQRRLAETFPGVERTTFSATYPTARVDYLDPELPLDISLEASTPFVPLDEWASGLPAAIFTFTLHNPTPYEVHGALAGALQNAVGWDGVTPFDGVRNPLLGGNTNTLRREPGITELVMENHSLPSHHPGNGQMVLSALTENVRAYEQWTEPEQFRRFLEGLHALRPQPGQERTQQRRYGAVPGIQSGASPAGTTWAGGLMLPFWLAPGETRDLIFIMAWHFPNRYVNFDQFGPLRDYGHSRFWLGNAYATRFGDALDVAKHVARERPLLEARTKEWVSLLRESSLSDVLVEAVANQGSLIRSPTTFWTEDGNFFGFEGSLGASTVMWSGDFGGSCPLNCTHVWNYEMALSRLFPTLERSMRTTDLDVAQAPDGYIPHRTLLPLYLRQLWGEPIGGPTAPALDGMLGTILKSCREMRQAADRPWLTAHWPNIRRLIDYIRATWDDDDDGVLEGEQGNTYDIHFYGPNIYIGGLWLAALRAAEYLAGLAGDDAFGRELHDLFRRGSARYDELLWNGEYYIQHLEAGMSTDDQVGDGCLSDQLFGQWWAHVLDLGYILPEDHVRQALRSIVRYNTRRGFRGFTHPYRVFADQDDLGLLVCTWPKGNRPAVPVRYCDEVWTGIEYQVAAHCLMEGMVDEGLTIVADLRARYSGERRNPYNEVECGDHYARAMAGWSILEALSGLRYDAASNALRLVPASGRAGSRLPFVTATAWGELRQETAADVYRARFAVRYGTLEVGGVSVTDFPGAMKVDIDGRPVELQLSGDTGDAALPAGTLVETGSVLTLMVGADG